MENRKRDVYTELYELDSLIIWITLLLLSFPDWINAIYVGYKMKETRLEVRAVIYIYIYIYREREREKERVRERENKTERKRQRERRDWKKKQID